MCRDEIMSAVIICVKEETTVPIFTSSSSIFFSFLCGYLIFFFSICINDEIPKKKTIIFPNI